MSVRYKSVGIKESKTYVFLQAGPSSVKYRRNDEEPEVKRQKPDKRKRAREVASSEEHFV